MAYIGRQLVRGQNRVLDDISSSFNGSTTAFNLTVSSSSSPPASVNQLWIILGGILQKPGTDFTVADAVITFTTAPASTLSFWGMIQGDTSDINSPADASVTPSKIANSGDFAFPADVRFKDADGSHYVGLQAPSTVSSNLVWSLPAADGSANQVLKTDGSGALGWASDANAPEGTAVLSTGETGTTKYLRVDGDNTCSWQLAVDATKATLTGSTNNTITTVTGANAIQGEANLTFDGTSLVAETTIQVQGGSGDTLLRLHRTNAAGSNGNNFGAIKWTDNNSNEVASIRGQRSTAVDDADITFLTRTTGGSASERMRIESDGDFRLSSGDAGTNYGGIRGWNASTGDMTIDADKSSTGSSGSNLIIKTRGGERARIQHGGGISFNGDTAAANALDDYEEGTWTPTVHFGGNSTGIVYGSNNGGSYTKIGKFVHVHGRVELSDKGSSTGDATIRGLPFTVLGAQSGASAVEGGAFFAYQHNMMSDLDYHSPSGYLQATTTVVTIVYRNNSGDTAAVTNSDFENATSLSFEAFYPAT